jgi:hypothetical protein
MINLSNYLINLDLKELLETLEKDDDMENIMIILQMLELNDLAEIEKIKMELEAESQEEDILEDEQEKEEKKKKKQQELEMAKKKHEKTKSVIDSILEQPSNFWKTNEPSSFANSLLGTIIVPKTKAERSAVAGGILFGIAKSKNKTFDNEQTKSRQGLIAKIKEVQKEKAKEFVF